MDTNVSFSILATTNAILESMKEKESLNHDEFMAYRAYMDVLHYCRMQGDTIAEAKMVELGKTLLAKKVDSLVYPQSEITKIKSDIRRSVYL